MNIWRGLADVPGDLGDTAITIGVFDGVHRGHSRLIDIVTREAAARGIESVLMTFDPHPLAVIAPAKMPPMLGDVMARADLVEAAGINHMLAIDFSADMASWSPEKFFSDVLVGALHAKVIVVGKNFAFGHKASGTTETLKELGAKHGIDIVVVDLLVDHGERISSSLIRKALGEGDVSRAEWALGRPFSVAGEVMRGAGRGGRKLGYPTANLYFPDSVAIPADGVYCGWFTILDDAPVDGDMEPHVRYQTAVSVGTNPTFGDERRSVEAFVLDRDADLYGRYCRVEFVERLRGMEKFNGIDDLLNAMGRDVSKTRVIMDARTKSEQE